MPIFSISYLSLKICLHAQCLHFQQRTASKKKTLRPHNVSTWLIWQHDADSSETDLWVQAADMVDILIMFWPQFQIKTSEQPYRLPRNYMQLFKTAILKFNHHFIFIKPVERTSPPWDLEAILGDDILSSNKVCLRGQGKHLRVDYYSYRVGGWVKLCIPGELKRGKIEWDNR